MISVVCVLRSGGIYTPAYVRALARGVQENLSLPHKFVCLTDLKDSSMSLPDDLQKYVEVIPLEYGWPKWWSKVEVWNPKLGKQLGRILYVDLDSLVVGNLNDIAGYDGDLCILRDFYYLDTPSVPIANFISGRMKPAWKVFSKNPHYWMQEGDKCVPPHFGDQILVSKAVDLNSFVSEDGHLVDYWQDILPGQVVSYKIHCQNKPNKPENARLIGCHGVPKPPDIKDLWFRSLWLRYSREK
jgi:hypothetical protein